MSVGDWPGSSPQRLVMFLTALGRCSTTSDVEQVAAELVAEEFDAEVGAVVDDRTVGAAVGFGLGPVPAEDLIGVRPGMGVVDLGEVGRCHTLAAAWSADGNGRLVVARTEPMFDGADRDLLLGMAGALGMAAGAIHALERERARQRALEVLLGLQRSISHRAPLATILAQVTEGASELLRGCPVALVLDDDLDPAHPVHVGAPLAAAGDVFAAPVHVQGSPAGYLRAAPVDGRPLREEDQALLLSFAEHASMALTDARTLEAMAEAFHDPLTGLPNRPLFEGRLTDALAAGEPVAVLFVDLDRFKAVNDTMGHAAGDDLLLEVADRIRSTVRAHTSAARFGGDEFAVLIGADGDADDVAGRIIDALARPFAIGGKDVVIGASVGIARAGDGRTAPQLLADADLAMYRAKAAGGGRSTTFDPQMRRDLIDRLDLEADLRGALERDELSVVYQPIVDLVTGRPAAFEALLRWHSPTRGDVPPAVLVPVAEATGQIVPIGRWVLQEACAAVGRWRRGLPDLRIAVNVSVHQLREPQFADEVAQVVREAGLTPDVVVVEVTESALINDEDQTVRTLHDLAARGFAVALDDFGTGYSSLSYLQRFPVAMLKIDRSFVSGGLGGKSDQLVRTVIELGRAYDLDVVAEGIEDEDQLHRLVQAGCRFGQGYHLGRPARFDVDAERLVRAGAWTMLPG